MRMVGEFSLGQLQPGPAVPLTSADAHMSSARAHNARLMHLLLVFTEHSSTLFLLVLQGFFHAALSDGSISANTPKQDEVGHFFTRHMYANKVADLSLQPGHAYPTCKSRTNRPSDRTAADSPFCNNLVSPSSPAALKLKRPPCSVGRLRSACHSEASEWRRL